MPSEVESPVDNSQLFDNEENEIEDRVDVDLIFNTEAAIQELKKATTGMELKRIIDSLPRSQNAMGKGATMNRVIKVMKTFGLLPPDANAKYSSWGVKALSGLEKVFDAQRDITVVKQLTEAEQQHGVESVVLFVLNIRPSLCR